MNAVAATSGSTPDISVAATILINGNEIPINSESIANIKKGIKFSLENPVVLGTLQDLFDFINSTFGSNLQVSTVTDAISSWPSALKTLGDALNGIITSTLTVNILNIDTNTGLFQIGITITPQTPVKILGDFLELESIGFGVTRTGS